MPRFALMPVWITFVIAGLYVQTAYEQRTGEMGKPNVSWTDNAHISPDPDNPTLLMFVHPHCPCTRASLSELSILMTKCQERVGAYVVFVLPAGVDEDWAQTDLLQQAERIAGVTVLRDVDGELAELFHAHTSGQTLLYDKKSQLRFCGGITPSRGHHGDSDGRRAVVGWILRGVPNKPTTPVYGCPLQNTHT